MGPAPPLNKLKALSFDIYGTLVDWETGTLKALQPLISQLPKTHPAVASHSAAIADFNKHEKSIIGNNPTILYDEALRQGARGVTKSWGLSPSEAEIQALPDSVPEWENFPDTVAAMQTLGKYYKLIALSNVSKELFAKTMATTLKDVRFDAAYLAEEIGAYKPSPKNFEFLLSSAQADLGVSKEELMHVAHGVTSDQVPAEEIGISHAWIERGHHNWGDVEKPEGMRCYKTLGDMAADVEEAFRGTS